MFLNHHWHYLNLKRFELFQPLHFIKGLLIWSFTLLFTFYIVFFDKNDVLKILIIILSVFNFLYEVVEAIAFCLFKPSL